MLKTEERFTYEQYLTWPDDERWELIDGQAYAMGPAPSFRHQELVLSIAVQLTETDASGNQIIPVVEPDVLVFCAPASYLGPVQVSVANLPGVVIDLG